MDEREKNALHHVQTVRNEREIVRLKTTIQKTKKISFFLLFLKQKQKKIKSTLGRGTSQSGQGSVTSSLSR